MPPSLRVSIERWPLAETFTISRGSKREADVVVTELTDGPHRGRGECVPYPRYGETVDGVAAAVEAMAGAIARGLDRVALQDAMPPGAARNGLDCAFWDLEAKRSARPVFGLAGLPEPRPVVTAYTISLDEPEAMARAAARVATRPLLKVKLGAAGDAARIAAVRHAAPEAQLIVDANEGWTADDLADNLAACAAAGVTLVEQPLPADADEALAAISRPIPVCADESVHDRASLPALAGKYDAVNIKLDKTGGLTEALAVLAEAERRGFSVMIGCMVSTSLALAPALMLAGRAHVVDLDGPLLLARDRPDGLRYDGSRVYPPHPVLWG
ncbi:MAG TPA: N-acetyl-D-Glu racemase DgcA [Xanthobacteraceae bacterium]|nr:N-acetyl-D-Glu racemase DgcA [Xanthobacteraceae bacterium]